MGGDIKTRGTIIFRIKNTHANGRESYDRWDEREYVIFIDSSLKTINAYLKVALGSSTSVVLEVLEKSLEEEPGESSENEEILKSSVLTMII